MAHRTFTHHPATPGLILTLKDNQVVKALCYGSFNATVYVRTEGEPGYTGIPVEACNKIVEFDDALTQDPEPASEPAPEAEGKPQATVTDQADASVVPGPAAE